MLDQDFTINEISKLLSVSESTIYRRMRQFGISKMEFSTITDQELDCQTSKITAEFPHCGEGIIKQILLGKNIKVQRWRLRESLHRVDAEGIAQRRKGRLHRRVYHVQGPNHLWHVDTNHKLIRWNLVIIGGIDGFSCLPVMLKCSDNNKADTMLTCFVDAVRKYGLPSRVRTDKGLENVGIAQEIKVQSDGEQPIILSLLALLPEACQNELGSETWTQTNHGMDDYIKALNIISCHFN